MIYRSKAPRRAANACARHHDGFYVAIGSGLGARGSDGNHGKSRAKHQAREQGSTARVTDIEHFYPLLSRGTNAAPHFRYLRLCAIRRDENLFDRSDQ